MTPRSYLPTPPTALLVAKWFSLANLAGSIVIVFFRASGIEFVFQLYIEFVQLMILGFALAGHARLRWVYILLDAGLTLLSTWAQFVSPHTAPFGLGDFLVAGASVVSWIAFLHPAAQNWYANTSAALAGLRAERPADYKVVVTRRLISLLNAGAVVLVGVFRLSIAVKIPLKGSFYLSLPATVIWLLFVIWQLSRLVEARRASTNVA